MSKALLLAAGLSVAMTPAFAGEIIFGVGVDDALSRTNSSAGAFTFEYHLDPAWEGRNWTAGWGTVAQFDGDNDVFVGVNIQGRYDLGERWFVEGSFGPGYYDAGSNGTDLGSDFQFRSLIGVGAYVGEASQISIAIEHKSHGNLSDGPNPGVETISLRYGRRF
ncbi:MAG: acyloxyacyl hydrolase [Rhodovulum sp.]|jgi:lipid A 3-O-deacylase|nr:acyloxyacyl hydrolase [Rhodovulum sp.]